MLSLQNRTRRSMTAEEMVLMMQMCPEEQGVQDDLFHPVRWKSNLTWYGLFLCGYIFRSSCLNLMITLLISDRKDGLFPSPLFGFFMPGFSNRQLQVPKNKHICGIRELILKTLPLSNICYSFASCLLIFEKMVSHRISIRIHTILQALNTLLGSQFTAWAFLLKGRDNFLSKSHREVADLTKVK